MSRNMSSSSNISSLSKALGVPLTSITSLTKTLGVPLLDPSNYSLWEARFKVFLAAHKCLDGIEKAPHAEQRMTVLDAIGDEDSSLLLNQTMLLSEPPFTPASSKPSISRSLGFEKDTKMKEVEESTGFRT
jgi:hypothetical protein